MSQPVAEKSPWEREIQRIVGEAVGTGSICWEHMEGTGLFNQQLASETVDNAVKEIMELLEGATA
jgi:hypothetical protein